MVRRQASVSSFLLLCFAGELRIFRKLILCKDWLISISSWSSIKRHRLQDMTSQDIQNIKFQNSKVCRLLVFLTVSYPDYQDFGQGGIRIIKSQDRVIMRFELAGY